MPPGVVRPDALIREYPVSQWIIWAGAGVSLDPPTSLPLGYPFTDFAVEEMCGGSAKTQLLDVWDRANRLCSTPGGAAPFGWRPRLESVLGGFAELERGAEPGLAFLPGFTSFADAPPNPKHLAIAALVLRGATVFTSNFDLCIQAFRELPSRDEAEEVAASGSIRRFRVKDRPGTGEIVHFHGAADEPGSLGATLSRVKEGFPRPFSELEDRLRAGSLIVMVGYSAGDSFDVNPYFAGRSPDTWPASALLFVQHKGV